MHLLFSCINVRVSRENRDVIYICYKSYSVA